MLTPEQSRMRVYENEMRELRKENADLEAKLETARKGMAFTIRELAKHMSWRNAYDFNKLADELDAKH